MNKKNKILLATIGLAFLSGIAAISSTFAWFYTARTASLHYSSAKVVTKEGNLDIAFKSSLNSGMTDTGSANEIILDGINDITDVSSDGLVFYKPVWNSLLDKPSARVANEIPTVGATSADGYYVDFTITISLDDIGDDDMKVYLGPDTKIIAKEVEYAGGTATPEELAQEAKNAAAVKAARLAVISAADAVVLIYSPEAEAGGHKHIVEDAGEDLYSVDGYTTAVHAGPYYNAFVEYTDVTTAEGATTAIASVAKGASVDVTFRAWLEGEDVHCDNDAIGGLFDIELQLYGLPVNL